MPNSNIIINIAPTTDITVSTLTNPDFFVHLYDFKTLLQKYKE